MEFVLIKENSNEWNEMWGWLASHPLNEGLEEPMVALNDGEAWQYMGSYRGNGNSVVHSFRHRSHPLDNEIKNISVNGSQEISEDDIERTIPIK